MAEKRFKVWIAQGVVREKPCPKCGQTDIGQTGEYPCNSCGLPTLWDKDYPQQNQPKEAEDDI